MKLSFIVMVIASLMAVYGAYVHNYYQEDLVIMMMLVAIYMRVDSK